MNDIQTMLRDPLDAIPAEDARHAARRFADRAQERDLIDVRYTHVDSPIGGLLIAATSRGLVRVAFSEEDDGRVLQEISDRISPRVLESSSSLDPVRRELEEYFSGIRRGFDFSLDRRLIGGFARKVLSATSAIPYGGFSTYGEVSARAGSPRASRAAGNALGSNPIPVVIPCHRVLRSGGMLGGYAGGSDRKRYLLELERALPAKTL
jgi:methylated-DNA-[protein]-cysteine S-methyltransferase